MHIYCSVACMPFFQCELSWYSNAAMGTISELIMNKLIFLISRLTSLVEISVATPHTSFCSSIVVN